MLSAPGAPLPLSSFLMVDCTSSGVVGSIGALSAPEKKEVRSRRTLSLKFASNSASSLSLNILPRNSAKVFATTTGSSRITPASFFNLICLGRGGLVPESELSFLHRRVSDVR